MSRELVIYINPNAANGKLDFKTESFIQESFHKRGITAVFEITETMEEFQNDVEHHLSRGVLEHIVVGGDGSLFALVNIIKKQIITDKNSIKIGLLPGGTGNDWLRNFSLEGMSYFVNSIAEDKTKKLDIGLLEFEDRDPVFFSNMGGLGFNGQVIKKIQKVKWMGKMSYYAALLMTFFEYNPSTFSLKIGDLNYNKKFFILTYGIGKYAGGNMMLCPNAIMNDGLFDINIIETLDKWKLIQNLFRLNDGSYLQYLDVISMRSNEIRMNQPTYVEMEVDGESIIGNLLTIKCLKEDLNFFC